MRSPGEGIAATAPTWRPRPQSLTWSGWRARFVPHLVGGVCNTHSISHGVITFNADFYSVAATIVPVIFVALLFPGGMLAHYALWAKRWRSKRSLAALRSGKRLSLRLWIIFRAYDLLMLPVTLAFVLGTMGELASFIALDHRSATHLEHSLVFAAVLTLPVLAAMSATLSISLKWSSGVGVGTDPLTDEES